MKRIAIFYLLSCLSIIVMWLAIDDYDIESMALKPFIMALASYGNEYF